MECVTIGDSEELTTVTVGLIIKILEMRNEEK